MAFTCRVSQVSKYPMTQTTTYLDNKGRLFMVLSDTFM